MNAEDTIRNLLDLVMQSRSLASRNDLGLTGAEHSNIANQSQAAIAEIEVLRDKAKKFDAKKFSALRKEADGLRERVAELEKELEAKPSAKKK